MIKNLAPKGSRVLLLGTGSISNIMLTNDRAQGGEDDRVKCLSIVAIGEDVDPIKFPIGKAVLCDNTGLISVRNDDDNMDIHIIRELAIEAGKDFKPVGRTEIHNYYMCDSYAIYALYDYIK